VAVVVSYIRWKALLPLSVTLALILLWGVFFADWTLKLAVEKGGTAAVGAKVELADANLGFLAGNVTLEGLQVTNPNAPMTNLFEVEALVFDVGLLPALEKKIVIDTVAARGIRFNTPRQVSGALPPKPAGATEEASSSEVIERFKSQIKVPPLELSTLTQSVDVGAISADSLATLREARHTIAFADTARDKLLADLQAADPRPTLDSAEALARRLQNANLRTLGLAGARQAVTDVRRTLRDLAAIDDRLKAFEAETRGNAAGLQDRLAAIPAARTADYAYARSLLKLPSFEVPSIGPQLFSDLIAEKMGGVLYWVDRAEKYLPPGLQQRTQPGPERLRASGTDVLFPKENVYPQFLMRLAELSLTLGGEGASAGAYDARIAGLTSQPAVYGAPTTFAVSRTAGQAGPRDIRIDGFFDHRRAPVRDTVSARLAGIDLPTFPLGGLGGAVRLGTGDSRLTLERSGDELRGRWLWRAPNVTWQRDTTRPRPADARAAQVEDVLWRALARIDSVEIDAEIRGSLRAPRLAVRTNIAEAVSAALKAQLADEVRRAEQQVRARVDALVDRQVAEARAKADAARTQVMARIDAERQRLEAQKAALETRLRELTRIPGIG
jgi:uncharacterized protein (TIGR03545 family)